MNNKNLVGVGLRHIHFPHIEEEKNIRVDFFEVISENFMYTRGRPFDLLMKAREKFPICLHGVSLSLAANEEVDIDYLSKLKELISIVDPLIVSDHLCFTGLKASNVHNLLPFSYTKENLIRLEEKVQRIQDVLKRQMCFENLSAYFTLKNSEMCEAEFLNELCKRTDAGMLLDLNNLYVNSINQKFEVDSFLSKIEYRNVKQIHLAGYSDLGDFLFDTHANPVYDDVWKMLKKEIKKLPEVPILIEWDEDIPTFEILEEEALKARDIVRGAYE